MCIIVVKDTGAEMTLIREEYVDSSNIIEEDYSVYCCGSTLYSKDGRCQFRYAVL